MFPYILSAGFDEFLLYGRMDNYIIGCNTGLSRITELAPHDLTCRNLYIGCRINDTGGLASKLQGYRDQLL